MTIKELYEWAIDHDVENFDIELETTHGVYKSVYEYDLEIDRLHETVDVGL